MEDYRGFVEQKREVENAYLRTNAHEIFPTLGDLSEAAQTLQAHAHKLTVESFRSNPRVAGCNVVQLFDSNANEVDGLVDFWRNKRKKSFYVFQELNKPPAVDRAIQSVQRKGGSQGAIGRDPGQRGWNHREQDTRLAYVGPGGTELFSNIQR